MNPTLESMRRRISVEVRVVAVVAVAAVGAVVVAVEKLSNKVWCNTRNKMLTSNEPNLSQLLQKEPSSQ